MTEPVKPCELPCPKCGASNVRRTFRAKRDRWDTQTYGGYYSKYASNPGGGYHMEAFQDHIEHACRVCQYRWQAKPLSKPRKAKTAA